MIRAVSSVCFGSYSLDNQVPMPLQYVGPECNTISYFDLMAGVLGARVDDFSEHIHVAFIVQNFHSQGIFKAVLGISEFDE